MRQEGWAPAHPYPSTHPPRPSCRPGPRLCYKSPETHQGTFRPCPFRHKPSYLTSWSRSQAAALLSHSTCHTSPVSVSESDPKQLTCSCGSVRARLSHSL